MKLIPFTSKSFMSVFMPSAGTMWFSRLPLIQTGLQKTRKKSTDENTTTNFTALPAQVVHVRGVGEKRGKELRGRHYRRLSEVL